MRITRWFKNASFVILAISVAGLSACTKSNSSKTASIKLSLPDPNVAFAKANTFSRVGSLSLKQKTFYSRIMINIQGGGLLSPIVHIQEMKDLNQSINLNPQFDVPRGTTPNIQVLLIASTKWVDASTGQTLDGSGGDGEEKFYYGDAMNVVLKDDLQNIPISVSAMGITQGVQGAIAGRLIDGDGTGVTGKVAIKIVPVRADGSKAPPMIVSQTEIHGGWFEFVAFQGLNFSYILDDGSPSGRELLPGMNIDTIPAAGVLPQNQAFITIPTAYRSLYSSGSEIQRTSWPGARFWIGYFGPGAPATNKACYDSATGANMQYVYTSSTVGDTAQVQWAGASPDATHAGVSSGGVGASNGNCGTAAGYWSSWLKPMPSRLSDGHDLLGIRGPFRVIDGSNGGPVLLDTVYDGSSSLTLKWGYLPGAVQNGRIDGVGVFQRILATAPGNYGGGRRDYELDDLLACNRLTDPKFFPTNGPFQFVTQVPVTAALTQTTTLSGINPSDYSSGKVQIVLCPYANNRHGYYNAGIDNNSGDGGTGPATKLAVVGPSANQTSSSDVIATNVCTPLTLIPQDSNGRQTWMPPSPSLTVTATANESFFSEPTCQTALTSNNINWYGGNNTSRGLIYVKTAATGTAFTVTANVTAPASGGSPALNITGNLSLTPAGGSAPSKFKFLGLPSSLMAFTCYPVMAVALDSSGRMVAPGSTPISFPSVGSSNLFVYGPQDESCLATSSISSQSYSLPRPSPSPAVASGFVPLYMRYVGTSNVNPATNIVNGITFNSTNFDPSNATVTQPGAAAKLKVMMPGQFEAEQCNWAIVKLVDSAGYETPASSNVTVSVNTDGSPRFYSLADTNCTSVFTSGPTDVTIPAGATQVAIRLRELSTSAKTFSATTSSAGINSSSQTISVSAAQVAKLVITGPGQSYTAPSITGSLNPLTSGTAVTATISALSILGNPVTPGARTFTINIGQPGSGSITFNGQSASTSVNFGVGSTINVNLICNNGGAPTTLSGAGLSAPGGSPYNVLSSLSAIPCN